MGQPLAIGRYQVTQVLGSGAMGIVYRGYDTLLKREVAIKTLHQKRLENAKNGRQLLDRFKQEAKAGELLKHPNVVAVYDYGEEPGIAYITMEYLEGEPLRELIRAETPFSVEKVVCMVQQILEGLSYFHHKGIVHRDIKPANIIVVTDGRVKVADFGIAHLESACGSGNSALMGTPNYMSPEQFLGNRVSRRSDLFSCGVILYELLTGVRPFRGKKVSGIMQQVLNLQPPDPRELNQEVSESLAQGVLRALAKESKERFESAEAFSKAIE